MQVVCPGCTATEFHRARGAEPVADDAEDVVTVRAPAMPASDVVTAPLAALAAGEVVCVPRLGDPAAVQRLVDAERDLREGSAPRLAPGTPGDRTADPVVLADSLALTDERRRGSGPCPAPSSPVPPVLRRCGPM